MSDLISRSALMEKVNEIETNFYVDQFEKYNPVLKTVKIINCIEDAPTVDAVPVVRGEWLVAYEGIERNLNTWEHIVKYKYFCNRCDYSTGNQGKYFNFCPNCGADMRKKVEE